MNVEQKVIGLLTENKLLRANDKMLMLEFWKREGLELTPHQQQVFMQVTSPETIRRNRQKIQERGLCMPDDKTYNYRQSKAEEIRLEIRDEKAPILRIDPFTNS